MAGKAPVGYGLRLLDIAPITFQELRNSTAECSEPESGDLNANRAAGPMDVNLKLKSVR